MDSKTIYVTIGNSDDKLTQDEWAKFYNAVDRCVDKWADQAHGRWHSLPNARWQNACWCFELLPAIGMEEYDDKRMQDELKTIALHFNQNSIAWAEAQVSFIEGNRFRS